MEGDLLPGPQGKIPKMYEVDKERHTESYITAIRGHYLKQKIETPVLNQHYMNSFLHAYQIRTSPLFKTQKWFLWMMQKTFQLRASSPLLEQTERTDKFRYTIAEMERYRNDPFWKTLRWLLFILFWLLWVLMFLVAILIVILSPSCVPKAVPNWWQSAIVYQIWTPSFQDSDGNGVGDFTGLTNRLENLRRLGIQVVWLNPFLLSDDFNDAVRDHLAVDPKLGTNDDAYKLIDTVHDKEMKIVISLPVSTTSKDHMWYRRSSQASLEEYANFSNYYHWWNAEKGSLFMSKHKNFSYMHYKNRSDWPILNWQSGSVRQDMFVKYNVILIDKGIDGFCLNGIEYLARMKSGSLADWSRIIDILRDIRNHVDTYVEKTPVLFATRDNANENEKKELILSGLDSVISYELGSIGKDSKICHLTEGNIAGCIHEILTELMHFHATKISLQCGRIASRVKSQQQAELLSMLQLLLPGTNSIYYGDEIGMLDLPVEKSVPVQRGAMQWDDSANAGFSSAVSSVIPVHPNFISNNWAVSSFDVPKMARLRKSDETLNSGGIIIGQLTNSSFTIMRYPDNENTLTRNSYLGMFNFGESKMELPIRKSNIVENKEIHRAMVIASTSNAEQYYYRQIIDLSSGIATIPPEQGVIFKFIF
ncbi:Neutral and basic amino acid transport protein rBAT [Dirofilaria immitis]|nr:Neutral and basic amino acid transport protein rBAT [Dirofilaria immitis]